MERSWYWRVALIVAVALFSLWQLVPSWFYFKLPPDERNGEAYEQSVPGWAPHRRSTTSTSASTSRAASTSPWASTSTAR